MIQRIREYFTLKAAHTPDVRALANCPDCMAFVRSVAAVRLAKHLACCQTGHGMSQDATIATLARVIRLLDAQAKRNGLRKEVR